MGNKLRRGRPRKGSAERKSESVLLKLEPGEKQAFAEAAAIAGAPLSVWMRERMRKAARLELESANRPVPFIRIVIPQ